MGMDYSRAKDWIVASAASSPNTWASANPSCARATAISAFATPRTNSTPRTA